MSGSSDGDSSSNHLHEDEIFRKCKVKKCECRINTVLCGNRQVPIPALIKHTCYKDLDWEECDIHKGKRRKNHVVNHFTECCSVCMNLKVQNQLGSRKERTSLQQEAILNIQSPHNRRTQRRTATKMTRDCRAKRYTYWRDHTNEQWMLIFALVWERRKITVEVPSGNDYFVKTLLLNMFTKTNQRSYVSDEDECDELAMMWQHLHENWDIVMGYQVSDYDPMAKEYKGRISGDCDVPVIDFKTLVKDSIQRVASQRRTRK